MLKKKMLQALLACTLVSCISVTAGSFDSKATNTLDVLPSGGFALWIEDGVSIEDVCLEEYAKEEEEIQVDAQLILGDVTDTASDSENQVLGESSNRTISDMVIDEDGASDTIEADGSVSQEISMVNADMIDINDDEDAVSFITLGVSEGTKKAEELNAIQADAIAKEEARDPEHFSNLVIADVNDYVNVRETPDTEGEIVGKLYDDSVGEFLEETNGWYKITSGNVTGYVKSEYCVTGDAAIELAKEVGQRMAIVNTTTLKVREEASTESTVLGLVPIEEDLSVIEEMDGWVKVSIEEGEGYVSTDYVVLHTDFVHAESKAEEEARLEKERKAKEEAKEAARKAQEKREAEARQNTTATKSSEKTYTVPSISGDGSMGTAVAQYACQFVGNPYVYGGTSLTNGTDCSGFVMSVYNAFGVSLPHSSSADRSQGYAVEGGLANAKPGDILCYSGHVALYIGGGQIVHASTSKTGIVISRADYRNILAVRRIF